MLLLFKRVIRDTCMYPVSPNCLHHLIYLCYLYCDVFRQKIKYTNEYV